MSTPATPIVPLPDGFRPTTREVAVFIKNRTVDQYNNYVGDFTGDTVVTDETVDDLIDSAGSLVLSALHWDPDAPNVVGYNVDAARGLIALLTAIFVELTKFSEQIARGVSPYTYLKEMFDGQLAQKQGELGITSSTDSGLGLWDLVAKQSNKAKFQFPDDPMVNWRTAL
jgi:hypothetical protein